MTLTLEKLNQASADDALTKADFKDKIFLAHFVSTKGFFK